jgi:hypothetical protein
VSNVHNHGPNEGRGTFCPERRNVDGRLVGACLRCTFCDQERDDLSAGGTVTACGDCVSEADR